MPHVKTDDVTLHEAFVRLLDITRQLAATQPLPAVLEQVVNAARSIVDADRGTVFLYDHKPAPGELYMITGTGLESLRFGVDKGIAGQCATDRQIINVPDCYADHRFHADVDRDTGYRTNCLIAAPLIGLDNQLVGVMQLLNAKKGGFGQTDEQIVAALAAQAAVAIQRAMLLDARDTKIKMEQDLKLAQELQRGCLPTVLPACDQYDLAGFNRPAEETGGDIYDALRMVTREPVDPADAPPIMLMIADATGHGVGPALSVTQARSMFRMALRLRAPLDDIVQHLDEQLYDDLGGYRFVTAFLGQLAPDRHELHYHAPGQGPLLFYSRSKDEATLLRASSPPLGVSPDLPRRSPDPLTFEPGDILMLATDGFYECPGIEEGSAFGEDRVVEIIRTRRDESAQKIIDELVRQADHFAAGLPQVDDLTALCVKRR